MELDERIKVAEDLIRRRKEIDEQLAELFGGGSVERKQRACGKCGKAGHNAKTCVEEAVVQ